MSTIAAQPGFSFGDVFPLGYLFLGLAVFAAIGALSHEHERAYSASLIYLALGLLAAVAIDVMGVSWLDPVADAKVLERASELALIVALFSAGLKVEREVRWRSWRSVGRLLGVAMPLTIAAVVLFGAGAMGLSLGAAIVLGAVLAPTDPVLAGDLGIGPPGEEEEREPNFALTAEAGLNDGLAFPFVLLGLVVAADGAGGLAEWALADVLYGVAVGIGAGVLGARLVAAGYSRLRDRGLLLAEYDGWLAIAAVLALYGLCEVAGGYGFIAAFAGGLSFRRYEFHHEYNRRVHDGAEVVGDFGELAVLLLVGSMVTVAGLEQPGLEGWLLVPLLLFVVRPLAVLASLARAPLSGRERVFVAWFGVRGVGSIYYAAAAVTIGGLAAGEARQVVWTAIACVLVSIALHGVTASPLGRRLLAAGRREAALAGGRGG